MWTQAILLLFVVGSAFGSIAIQQAKLGERVELNLGSGVVTWKRETSNGDEFIKYCGPTEKGPRCSQFVKEDNTPVKPESSAHVEPSGVLVIDSFKKSDEGLYSSPDLKPRETKNPDGSISAVAAPTIQLMLAN
ncbi:unnamed protein product [Haemonchus placei]|uniref:Secreted protein n=1 Tax=Haemonchus placei TaxID=6290 RepID=A0A0N4W5J8_HAEPC|nr:unnamed protein product [Haemonchus placei]